jgi:serine/threonine protein kinase
LRDNARVPSEFPAPEPPVHSGRLRGLGYELLEPLGHGGMGEVWRARDLKLDREVAIKFIAAATGSEHATQRFGLEARALARISHPNVVAVYSLGEIEGQPFLVYELVDGTSLDELIGELSWTRALAIIIDLARGLMAAHQVGVLHRDLKPANAMLTADGVGKLIDFGLAKLDGELLPILAAIDDVEPSQDAVPVRFLRSTTGELSVRPDLTEDLTEDRHAPSNHEHTNAQGLTRADTMLGTPRYVAPELWLGKPASASSDVYALALVAWELLSSRHAHVGAVGPELARMIVDVPLPKLSELRPDLPLSLAAVIDRGVAKRPLDRFRTAAEFCEALDRVRTQLSTTTAPSGSATGASGPSVSGPSGSGPWVLARPSSGPISGVITLPLHEPTRWVAAGDLNIALQQFGSGPNNVLFVPSWVSHVEAAWRFPPYASFMSRLGQFARVTVFDKRGTGMSDRIGSPVPIEERMLDIPAILDALELESVVLFGMQDGAALASVFAAAQPERVEGLICYASARRLLEAADYPFGMPAPMFAEICGAVMAHWGTPLFADFAAPSLAQDPEFLAWWSEYMRNGASPGTAKWMLELNATMDIAPVLPAIGVPTLVAHRRGDRMMPLPGGKMVADGILGARWIEFDGDDHLPWVGDSDSLLAVIAEFLADLEQLPRHPRRLLSLLAADGQVRRCRGPVDALRQALAGRFGAPALVEVGASDTDLEREMSERLALLHEYPAGSVFAGESAVVLCGGSGLRFEPVPAFARERLFEVFGPA